eukprot:gene9893-12135_t
MNKNTTTPTTCNIVDAFKKTILKTEQDFDPSSSSSSSSTTNINSPRTSRLSPKSPHQQQQSTTTTTTTTSSSSSLLSPTPTDHQPPQPSSSSLTISNNQQESLSQQQQQQQFIKSNPCELPPKYANSLSSKSESVNSLHKFIHQSTNDQKTRSHILHLVETKFQEWLMETDNIRQINDLINMKR